MKKTISVTGLDCAHCAAEFEKIVRNCDGIESASMNFMLEKMIVTAESEDAVNKALCKAQKAFPDSEWE